MNAAVLLRHSESSVSDTTLPLQYFPNYKLKCLVDRKARHSSRGRPQGIWDTP